MAARKSKAVVEAKFKKAAARRAKKANENKSRNKPLNLGSKNGRKGKYSITIGKAPANIAGANFF